MIKEKSCEERIAGEMKERELQFKELMDNPNHDDYFDDPTLGIDTRQLTRVILSAGGPADRIEIEHSFGEVDAVWYVYQDWYDGARREVLDSSPLWAYAVNLIEGIDE
jgi:hypothetical protein